MISLSYLSTGPYSVLRRGKIQCQNCIRCALLYPKQDFDRAAPIYGLPHFKTIQSKDCCQVSCSCCSMWRLRFDFCGYDQHLQRVYCIFYRTLSQIIIKQAQDNSECLHSHIQLKSMSKYLKILGQGIKFSLYLSGATLTGSALYLQYVNSQLGGIDLDREQLVKHYSDHKLEYNVSQEQAKDMYYWLLLDISMMRILTYSSYTTSCAKINKRIIVYSLKNYEQRGILKEIEAINAKPNPAKQKKVFNDVLAIRKLNFQNIEQYQFVVKQLRKQQKLMDTRKIIGLDRQSLQKIEKIRDFICKYGQKFNNAEIKKYNQQVPNLEQIFPGDVVHKILVI